MVNVRQITLSVVSLLFATHALCGVATATPHYRAVPLDGLVRNPKAVVENAQGDVLVIGTSLTQTPNPVLVNVTQNTSEILPALGNILGWGNAVQTLLDPLQCLLNDTALGRIVRRNNGTIEATNLPVMPGATQQVPHAMNESGLVVGDAFTNTGAQVAFLSSGGQTINLNSRVNDASWVLRSATDINNAGQILGSGRHNGIETYYRLTPLQNNNYAVVDILNNIQGLFPFFLEATAVDLDEMGRVALNMTTLDLLGGPNLVTGILLDIENPFFSHILDPLSGTDQNTAIATITRDFIFGTSGTAPDSKVLGYDLSTARSFDLASRVRGAVPTMSEVVAATKNGAGILARDMYTGSCGITDDCAVMLLKLAPQCIADTNVDGTITLQDLFSFLVYYFQSNLLGDVNGDSMISLQDIFDYLTAFFGREGVRC